MPDTLAGTKRRRARDQHGEAESITPDAEAAEARKRRAFLHTMGQQLREFGNEGVSPQDQSRNTFDSPGGRPASRAADSTRSQGTVQLQAQDVSGEDDQLPAGAAHSASKWLWQPSEVRTDIVEPPRTVVTFEDLLDWSQSYFDHWHPSFPFLHAPALLDHFREVARTGTAVSNTSASQCFEHVILRSVMSIATMDRRQMANSPRPLPSTLVFRTFRDAINSVQLVLTEESSILSLQALVSVQLFLVSMHRYNAASRLQGIAAHLAFQLGLYKCPNRTRDFPEKEVELRKRLFWSVFCIDRYISIRLGNPSVLSLEDVDVCYPQSEAHLITDTPGSGTYFANTSIPCAKVSPAHDDRLDLIDFLSRHANIRGSIMKLRSKTTVSHDYQDEGQALKVETEHAKWWTTVDEHLSTNDEGQSIAKSHQVTLIVLRFETILALHRSILGNPKHDTVFNAALQRCVTASRSIINTLHKALKGFGAFDGSPGQHGYESTPLLWPSFTWAVWMSAFVVIFAATEDQLSHKIAFGLADRSVEVLQHIALRGTNWPESCILAIKNLTARLRRSRDQSTSATRSETAEEGHARASENLAMGHSSRPAQGYPHPSSSARAANQSQMIHTPANSLAVPRQMSSVYYNSAQTGAYEPNGMVHFNTAPYQVAQQDAGVVTSNYLSGVGDFLGIAQQSSDIPRPHEDITQLFSGEDLTWCMGGDFGLGSGL